MDITYLYLHRNGFPQQYIHATLQQIELGLKHQRENFGLSLLIVSVIFKYIVLKLCSLVFNE